LDCGGQSLIQREGTFGKVVSSSSLSAERKLELKRVVQRVLNRACPENVATVVEQLADIEVSSLAELVFIIEAICQRALRDPHYCESYADLLFGLNAVWPGQIQLEGSNETPATFAELLMGTCRTEFERLNASFEAASDEAKDSEELAYMLQERRKKMQAFMQLIGNLFLRGLLSSHVIGSVLVDLVCSSEASAPGEHAIEAACELVGAVGATLHADPHGHTMLAKVIESFVKLRVAKKASSESGASKDLYSKRMQFTMQNTIDLSQNDWLKKSFKSKATTKDEIRRLADEEQCLKEQGEDSVLVTVAGCRPEHGLSRVGDAPPGSPTRMAATAAKLEVSPPSSPRPSLKSVHEKLESNLTKVEIHLPGTLRNKLTAPGNKTLGFLQTQTGTRIIVHSELKAARITGTADAVAAAKALLSELIDLGDPSVAEEQKQNEPDFAKETITLPEGFASKLIGPSGETVRLLQEQTNTRIFIHRESMEARVMGSKEAVAAALEKIAELIQSKKGSSQRRTDASSNAAPTEQRTLPPWSKDRGERKPPTPLEDGSKADQKADQKAAENCEKSSEDKEKKDAMVLPQGFATTLIGPGGDTVRKLQERTGARIFVDKDSGRARIMGKQDQVAKAHRLIRDLIDKTGGEKAQCKWFAMGKCHMGTKCGFRHGEAKSESD
jgi:rRNA processing protein Krr1/Pno1